MLRSGGNFQRLRNTYVHGRETDGVSKAVQASKDECDINVLVRRFGITGIINGVERPPPLTEFGNVFDFQSAMNVLRDAEASFSQVPAAVRRRFDNNPAEFVKFCSDEANLEEMRKMGLAVPKVEPEVVAPMKVEVVNGEAAKSGSGGDSK